MPWSERQRAMLREMGLRVWQPAAAALPVRPAARGTAVAEATPTTDTDGPGPPALAPRGDDRQARPPGLAREPVLQAPAAAANASSMDATPMDASAGAASALDAATPPDWPALREAVAGCRACRLCESRKQTVFGVGHPQAHWMVVGEAPGAQEDEQGEPFVGAAGQLLDSMLRALGLDRAVEGEPAERVFIANTLKCRPPGNRNPQPDEMQRCEPFLVRQIQLVRPRIILAMGRFAVQALLRTSEPIGRLRGRVHRYQGVPLVVTYHPAYLLRNPPDKARAWEDLCLAADVMDTGAAGAGTGSGERH